MLGRRILTSAARLRSGLPHPQPSVIPIALAITRRGYAAPAPEPKLDPLAPPIPGEMDPRFSEIPPWTVPAIERQNLTETPVEPYYDQQNRRYYGEPLSEEDEVLSTFATDVHNHVSVPFALKWFFGFAAAFAGMCYLIKLSAPGPIAAKRKFPYDGLSKELGGPHQKAPSLEEGASH